MKLTAYVDFERWWNNGVLLHKVSPARVADGHDLEDGVKTLITGVVLGIVAEYVVVFLNSSTPSFEQVIGIPVFGLVLVGNTAFWVAVFTAGSVAASDRSRVVPAATLACYALAGLIPIVLVTAGEQLNEAIKLFRVRQDPCLPYLAAATFDLLSPTNATALALIRSAFLLALQLGAAIWYLGVALPRVASRALVLPRWQVVAIVVITQAVDVLFVRYFLSCLSWSILGRMVLK